MGLTSAIEACSSESSFATGTHCLAETTMYSAQGPSPSVGAVQATRWPRNVSGRIPLPIAAMVPHACEPGTTGSALR